MADFFDRMKDGFNKGVATVSTSSKTLLEKNKINTIIKGLEDEKKQLAEILGNKVYNFSLSNPGVDVPVSELISICNEITSRNQQIIVQKKKIEELDVELNQVKGGFSTVNSSNACGCGYTNAAGAKFCAKCGSKLS